MAFPASQTIQSCHPAYAALRHVARYDALRLTTYRDRESHSGRIAIGAIGSVTALRFDDVGYFNRAYAGDDTVWERLGEIESFFRGGRWGCELVGPPSEKRGAPPRAGWRPGKSYAWLHGRVPLLDPQPESREFTIRAPRKSERLLFLGSYLTAFGADSAGHAAAVRNMRHLFEHPELDFLIAWRKDRPAGIGMLYRTGTSALLCAGATLPEVRRRGCHQALLTARLRLAADWGCRDVYSWAAAGGQSHANMERAGLRTVGITHAWRLDAERMP
jgi:GNAT superfamily N-acetyltransferase